MWLIQPKSPGTRPLIAVPRSAPACDREVGRRRVGIERLVEPALQEQRLAAQVVDCRIIGAILQRPVERRDRFGEALLCHQLQAGAQPIRDSASPVPPVIREGGTALATTRSRLSARMAKPEQR